MPATRSFLLRSRLLKTTLALLSLIVSFAIACTSQPLDPSATPNAAAGPVTWIKYQDPAEQAFTVDVPKGWKITGGTYRFGQLDPRPMADMMSPDGKIDIRLGDYHVPPFSTLTPTLMGLGWREGHPYSPRGLAQGVIANYRPGWVFADVYGQGRFSSQCQHLHLKSMKKAELMIPPAANSQTTAGEVVYACDSASGPQVAYVYAETQLTMMQGVGTWLVTCLYSFIASQDRSQEAVKLLMHSLSTFAMSEQWEYRQLQLNGQASGQIMRDFHQNMAAIQQDFQRRSAASQSQFDSIDRAIRGVDLTTDSIDGKQREVWTGTGNTHWINGLNQVVDSPSQPDPYSHRLNTVP
jgi:hypothetical protein